MLRSLTSLQLAEWVAFLRVEAADLKEAQLAERLKSETESKMRNPRG